MIAHFKQTIPIIRDNLSSSRKYYTQFCHKFVNSLIAKYITNLYKCRPTNIQDGTNNILGCEQLLLDTHSLKTILLNLPSIGSQVIRKAPASYTKVVVKGMTKAEMIIKVVMAPISPSNTFLEQFLKLLPDSNLIELHKILDMKGLKRADQTSLVELYKRSAPNNENNMAGNVIGSSTSGNDYTDTSSQLHYDTEGKGHIKKLEKLIKKRLPN